MKPFSDFSLLSVLTTMLLFTACGRVPDVPGAVAPASDEQRNRSFIETFQYQRFEAIDEQISERLEAALNPDLDTEVHLEKLVTEAEPIPGQNFSRNRFQQQTIDQTIVQKNRELINNQNIDLDKLRSQGILDATGMHSRQLLQERLIDQKFEEKNRSLLEE